MGHGIPSLVWLWISSMAPATAQEQPAEAVRLTVAAVQRDDKEFRVTLSGETSAPEGTVLVLRILPLAHRLGSNGRTLAPVPCEVDAVPCQAEVHRGKFTAVFTTPRLFQHEVRVTPVPPSDDAPTLTRTVLLFDPSSVEGRHRTETRLFGEHAKTVERFVSELEPYAKAGESVPAKMLKRLLAIEQSVRSWAETSDFPAAATVLTGLLSQMGTGIPWDTDAISGVYEELPYGRPELPDPGTFRIDPFTAKLRLARETALREGLLKILIVAQDLIAGTLPEARETSFDPARTGIPHLARVFAALGSGEFADVWRVYPLAEKLTALVAQTEEAARKLPAARSALQPEDAQTLRSLADQLKSIQEAVADPKDK